VADVSDSIAIQVPDEWTLDMERGPGSDNLPFLAAAPKLARAFYDSFRGPGVSVSLYDSVIEPADLLATVGKETAGDCGKSETRSFVTPYEGQIEVFPNCGGIGTRLAHIAVVDRATGLSAVLRIQCPTDKDFNAMKNIVASLKLTDHR
jgi:hypothetical protein